MSQNNETKLTAWEKVKLKSKIGRSIFQHHIQSEWDRHLYPQGRPQNRDSGQICHQIYESLY